MRLARTIGALVALIMAVTMGQALVSPSQAAKATKHQISAQGYEKGNTNKFYIKGKIATAPKTKVKILRNVSGRRSHTPGFPRRLLRAFAALRPALVRSEMRDRSS